MLLQTNSYVVPKEKKAEHARLMRRFRQALNRIGCDSFEVYEQVGANWSGPQTSGRYVQIMRFRDRKHQLAVQNAERTDPAAQALIQEFCDLINYPYQQQQGVFAIGYYSSALPIAPVRGRSEDAPQEQQAAGPVLAGYEQADESEMGEIDEAAEQQQAIEEQSPVVEAMEEPTTDEVAVNGDMNGHVELATGDESAVGEEVIDDELSGGDELDAPRFELDEELAETVVNENGDDLENTLVFDDVDDQEPNNEPVQPPHPHANSESGPESGR